MSARRISSIYRESRLWRDAVVAFGFANTAKQAVAHADHVVKAFRERYGDEKEIGRSWL